MKDQANTTIRETNEVVIAEEKKNEIKIPGKKKDKKNRKRRKARIKLLKAIITAMVAGIVVGLNTIFSGS